MRLHRELVVLGPLLFTLGISSRTVAQEPAMAAESRPAEGGFQARTAGRKSAVVAVVERVKASVVNIHSERTVQNSAGHEAYAAAPSQNRVNGMGTGIVVDSRGYIITNQHVVEDVSLLRIRLADGTSAQATVVARSPSMDLALLKIDVNRPLPVIPLGTASDLMVGETVVAIGNAYGYEHTVSVGVVSAIKRDVSLNKDMSYKSLIQTDASINPGNSGGPLLNIHGELVGVNVAIRAGAQGIGFAIPVDHMIPVVAEMLKTRRRSQAYDGLVCKDKLDNGADGPVRSVVIDRTDADGPALLAGLKRGDVVLRMGEVVVASSLDVERCLLDRKPGDSVAVLVRRQGKEERIDLALNAPDGRPRPGSNTDVIWGKLGLKLTAAVPDQVTKVNRQLNGGLEVNAVEDESPAGRAGIRRGDILVGLHQWETLSTDNIVFVLTHPELQTFNPLSFYIIRAGQVRRGWLQTGDLK